MRSAIWAKILLVSTFVVPSPVGAEDLVDPANCVQGVVQTEGADPVLGARVRLYAACADENLGALSEAETKSDGVFLLGPLPAHPHLLRIEAEGPGLAREDVRTFLGARLRIRLRPAGTLQGSVLTAESAEALPGAAVQVTSLGGSWQARVTTGCSAPGSLDTELTYATRRRP